MLISIFLKCAFYQNLIPNLLYKYSKPSRNKRYCFGFFLNCYRLICLNGSPILYQSVFPIDSFPLVFWLVAVSLSCHHTAATPRLLCNGLSASVLFAVGFPLHCISLFPPLIILQLLVLFTFFIPNSCNCNPSLFLVSLKQVQSNFYIRQCIFYDHATFKISHQFGVLHHGIYQCFPSFHFTTELPPFTSYPPSFPDILLL